MPTHLDALLSVGLFPGLSPAELAKKMGKKPVLYASLFQTLKKLGKENLIQKKNKGYFLAENQKAKTLFWLLQYCFKNSINYNGIVSQKTAQFALLGMEKGAIKEMPFEAKTVKKISSNLARHGFAVIDSKKPFSCRIVHSFFMERLVEYFSQKPKTMHKDFTEGLNEKQLDNRLEKEFSAFKKIAKKMPELDEIAFIHSSLSLEGNTLTLPETEKIIKQNIAPASKPFKDAQEALDYKKALDNFAFSGAKLDLENVLEFHRTAMNSMATGAGKIREQNVRIKGNPEFKTPNWQEVPKLLEEFFLKAKEFHQQKKQAASQIIEHASFLHSEFQRIHPFVDGNSRTARAIFTKILLEKGFPIVKIQVGFFDQYMSLAKLSKKRGDKKFAHLMKQITLENLKQAKTKIEYGQ
mgnify:CR=1 FL=1